jgi:SAM-dependent methyltransferase
MLDYAATARAFDAIAAGYDAAYGPGSSPAMAWLRAESLALLKAAFPPRSRLLEIGCGTGDEALHLARCGHTVVATDISPGMVAIAQEKARAGGLSGRVTAVALPAAQVGRLGRSPAFDGAYASFGALNCEPALPAALGRLLKPGAPFVCSVMARLCPFEIVWFLAHARPRLAFRRFKSGWQEAGVRDAGGSRVAVGMRYLSLGDLRMAFAPYLIIERSLSLPLLLPPPYLDGLYRKHPRLWERVSGLERRLRERRPWQAMGDHIAVLMRRPG